MLGSGLGSNEVVDVAHHEVILVPNRMTHLSKKEIINHQCFQGDCCKVFHTHQARAGCEIRWFVNLSMRFELGLGLGSG